MPTAEQAGGPLFGYTVGVTADRRRADLVNLLCRRGADVIEAPAIRILPLPDDAELLAATRACLSDRLDDVVVTTGIGFRGWLEAADGWGLGDQLRARLRPARLLTRGPKSRGAVRAAGLTETWSPESEAVDELVDYLIDQPLSGRRLAVQLHGQALPRMTDALRGAGAHVIEVPVYRWAPAADLGPVRRLVEQSVAGGIDALTFTSAPAVVSVLDVAVEMGVRPALLAALHGPVLAACMGPVCAAPLQALGVEALQPERGRLGALVRALVDELPQRARRFTAAGHQVELRGHVAVVDGRPIVLAAGPSAVLQALAVQPGHVLSRDQLLERAWAPDGADGHAVEMTVGRLRTALNPAGDIVQTVIKRGYRIAVG